MRPATWTRDVQPSFCITLRMWLTAVHSAIPSLRATSRLVRPSVTSIATSCSRRVSEPTRSVGRGWCSAGSIRARASATASSGVHRPPSCQAVSKALRPIRSLT